MAELYRKLAAELRQSRHRRDHIFGGTSEGFGEPGWEILLELYAAEAEERPMPVSHLNSLVSAPRSTTGVYLKYLSDHGMIVLADQSVQMTGLGFERMSAFLDGEALASLANRS